MKYIRTKDGIYWNILNGALSPQTWIGEPIAQADTIEELCDEFRNVTYGENPEISEPLTYEQAKKLKLKDFQRDEFAPNFKTFGAIWTDKGLIYVAKMNDKEELELI